MKEINVIITGAGAPGILGTVYSLKSNFDNRKINIIGTDIKSEVVGKYICNKFYKIPPPTNKEEYLATLKRICIDEKIDVLIPQNTMELELLSSSKNVFSKIGTKIIVSNPDSIINANNKYLLMKKCEQIKVPVGNFKLVNNFNDLRSFATILGWPNKSFVVKPPISNGLRGVRIIDEMYDPKEAFYAEKPNSLIINMINLQSILGESFPELIVTEYLPGMEYTVDMFRKDNKSIVIPRTRELIRSGITFIGRTIYHKDIINYSIRLAEELDLKYCFGFQFKLDENNIPKILESNPRVQGTMVLSTFSNVNVIYYSIKELLGEEVIFPEVKWGTRFLRYWGGVSEFDGKFIGQI